MPLRYWEILHQCVLLSEYKNLLYLLTSFGDILGNKKNNSLLFSLGVIITSHSFNYLLTTITATIPAIICYVSLHSRILTTSIEQFQNKKVFVITTRQLANRHFQFYHLFLCTSFLRRLQTRTKTLSHKTIDIDKIIDVFETENLVPFNNFSVSFLFMQLTTNKDLFFVWYISGYIMLHYVTFSICSQHPYIKREIY